MATEFRSSPSNLGVTGNAIIDDIEAIHAKGKDARVVVSEWRDTRSHPQRKTQWMWYKEMADQIKAKDKGDYTDDDLHEYFKDEYCPVKEIKFGDKVKKIKSTARLDTGEMHFYLQQIDMWAANAGFKLTIPVCSEYQELINRQNS